MLLYYEIQSYFAIFAWHFYNFLSFPVIRIYARDSDELEKDIETLDAVRERKKNTSMWSRDWQFARQLEAPPDFVTRIMLEADEEVKRLVRSTCDARGRDYIAVEDFERVFRQQTESYLPFKRFG